MQHISMMIFYPGGVSYGVPEDISDDREVYNIMHTAATIEEGNGNGKVKKRERQNLDSGNGKKVRNRR